MNIAAIETCPERDKYIAILMDEMHIKESLVYDKHSGIKHINYYCHQYLETSISGSLVGYTEIGDINSHLQAFEHSIQENNSELSSEEASSSSSGKIIADSMLVLMVRGLFTSLKFAYVQIPCISVSGHQMFHPFWNAVCRLERCGFKVLALTCDGLAANRRLFQLHGAQKDLTYKVLNPYASDDRFIFFFSDPPHLIKTTRNGWVNKCRHLWVSYEWIV